MPIEGKVTDSIGSGSSVLPRHYGLRLLVTGNDNASQSQHSLIGVRGYNYQTASSWRCPYNITTAGDVNDTLMNCSRYHQYLDPVPAPVPAPAAAPSPAASPSQFRFSSQC
uniref:HDC06503 n=1 Tax=Drosophila melanogaster TaxID=7227 RepID=Q6IGE6_DROME|nr:TPA_inf: HDC06503 [Drosophila melanogaster]